MNIKLIYPNCYVPVIFQDLTLHKESGNYCPVKDVITLCSSMQKDMPICRDIVYLHEIMHASGNKNRSFRRARLVKHFGPKAYRVEECIAEIGCMVAMQKLGVLNQYSKTIPESGLLKYYDADIYIPWREVISAVNYFKEEETDFSTELLDIRQYLLLNFNLRIKDTYEGDRDSSV